MNKQLVYLLLLLLFPLFFISCNSGTKNKDKEIKRQNVISFVEGFVVKPTVLDQTVMISGTLKAFEETVLMPDVAGRIISFNLPEGRFVKKGTLLVKLFDGDLTASLKKLHTQLEIAVQTEKRQSELLKVSGISQLEYDQTELQVHSIQDDIEVLKAQISKTEIVAPFDGVIGLRNVSVGAQVTPAIPLATIRMVDELKLDFSVPEKYSKEIREGKKVKFSVQGDETKYEAEVIASEEGIEASTRNLKVRAVVKTKKASLKPGAFANVELALSENKNALMIPTQAVIPSERDKKVIIVKNRLAKFVTVKTGVRQSSTLEVLEGLKAGDTVVTTGLLFIKPNVEVKFSKVS
jgi:membrane fusion protein, multidrug efflux system